MTFYIYLIKLICNKKKTNETLFKNMLAYHLHNLYCCTAYLCDTILSEDCKYSILCTDLFLLTNILRLFKSILHYLLCIKNTE